MKSDLRFNQLAAVQVRQSISVRTISAFWNLPHILQSEQSPKKLEVEMVILWLPSLLLSIVLSLGLTFLVNLLLKK